MLTEAQKATLKSLLFASADPVIQGYLANRNDNELEGYLNQNASPDFWVWKPELPLDDVYGLTSPAPSNAVWNWTFYSGLNAGEQGAWMEMAGPERILKTGRANVRSGIGVIFSGPQGGDTARDHILALARRLASRVEKMFATGTGSTASPADIGAEGPLSLSELSSALNLP